METLASFKAAALGVARRLPVSALAALVLLAAAALPGTSARADSLPFWEQADVDKAKAAAKTSGYKKYASKNSKKSYAKASTKKLGGHAEATEPVKKKKKGVKVAALGNSYYADEKPKKSLSGGGVRWVASSGCLDGGLKSVIYAVASNYGSVTVSSTCRSKGHNRAVGGASKSKHLTGDAADFRVHGNYSGLVAFVRSHGAGGVKHYGGGLFHIDNGPTRSW